MANKLPDTPNGPSANFFQPSTKDMIAYILLVLGIILLFFQHLYGGILIGIVAGVYFSKEILSIIRNANDYIEEQGLARSLIIAGILLAFLISAPAIFIGAAIVVGLRWFVFSETD